MRYLKLVCISLFVFATVSSRAQVSVNVNIGVPPPWGPVGYTEVRYYYLPDVEAYYDISSGMFIYFGGGVWLHRSYLPGAYRNYDLYNGYKVVMVDYRGNEPYYRHNEYRMKYKKGYRGPAQKNIRPRGGNDHPMQGSQGRSDQQQHKSSERPREQKSERKSQQHSGPQKQSQQGGNSQHGGGKGKK